MGEKSNKVEAQLKIALITLLREKELKYITISELCKEAEIHRSTFYKHYDDIDSLFESLEDHFLMQIDGFFASLNPFSKDSALKLIIKILSYLKENKEITNSINSVYLKPTFFEKVARMPTIYAKSKNFPLAISSGKMMNYTLIYIISGTMTLIRQWIANNYKESIEEIK